MELVDVHSKTVDAQKEQSAKTLTAVLYGLYALSILTMLSGLVAIIINVVKKNDVADTFLASHFRWQIRTFLISFIGATLGMACVFAAAGLKGLPLFITGVLLTFVSTGWFIYRVAKGWLYLNDNRSMYRRPDRHGLRRDPEVRPDRHRLRR